MIQISSEYAVQYHTSSSKRRVQPTRRFVFGRDDLSFMEFRNAFDAVMESLASERFGVVKNTKHIFLNDTVLILVVSAYSQSQSECSCTFFWSPALKEVCRLWEQSVEVTVKIFIIHNRQIFT